MKTEEFILIYYSNSRIDKYFTQLLNPLNELCHLNFHFTEFQVDFISKIAHIVVACLKCPNLILELFELKLKGHELAIFEGGEKSLLLIRCESLEQLLDLFLSSLLIFSIRALFLRGHLLLPLTTSVLA